ncbi:zinc finger domain-containing protein [Serratia marcescens]|nr:hypothetical protein [Serratia marcescens]
MMIFLQALDYDLWLVTRDGYIPPHTLVHGNLVLKHESEWTDGEKALASTNAKAMSTILCGIDENEYNRVSACDTAKKIWNILEVTYEGNKEVRAHRVSMLVEEYELFAMKRDESIDDMYARFTLITNSLKSLGREYPIPEQIRKILRILPQSWEAKKTAIHESKDLEKYDMADFIGSLKTYELSKKNQMAREEAEEGKTKAKNIALKATSPAPSSPQQDESSGSDEEISMLTHQMKRMSRRIQKLRANKYPNRQPRWKKSKEPANDEEAICYKCKKPGHIRANCPLRRVNGGSKGRYRAYRVGEWDSSDESEGEKEEVNTMAIIPNKASNSANYTCFMAKSNDDVEVHSSLDSSDFEYDDCETCQFLYDSLEVYKRKYKGKRDEIKSLVADKGKLSGEKEDLTSTNQLLLSKIQVLESKISSLEKGKEKVSCVTNTQLEEENEVLKKTIVELNQTIDGHLATEFYHDDLKATIDILKKNNALLTDELKRANECNKILRNDMLKVLDRFAVDEKYMYSSMTIFHGPSLLRKVDTSRRAPPSRPPQQPNHGVLPKRSHGHTHHRAHGRPHASTHHVHSPQVAQSHIRATCNYCGRIGHLSHKCHIRRVIFSNDRSSWKWVPKANPQGPKVAWVPRFTSSCDVGTTSAET